MAPDRHLELVARMTEAFAVEIDRHDPGAPVPWRWWPDVRTLVGHLGGVHAWAAEAVRSGEAVPDPDDVPAPVPGAAAWYRERRDDLLDALGATPSGTPCWVFTGEDRTAAFWRRRMVFETTKHLIDLRAAGGGRWAVAPEPAPADYADGVDELLEVFLARSRPQLAALPAPVLLEATDVDRRWALGRDWSVGAGVGIAEDGARVRARAGDLALLLWERADPMADPGRFEVEGASAVEALRDARIHR